MESTMKKSTERHSREFWVELVRRWRDSGESQRAVAEAAGVNVHTLQYWVAKLRAELSESKPRKGVPRFVEVQGVSVSPTTTACRLRLSDTMVLEMASVPPASWVRELVERC